MYEFNYANLKSILYVFIYKKFNVNFFLEKIYLFKLKYMVSIFSESKLYKFLTSFKDISF